jgi:hypothetical protein
MLVGEQEDVKITDFGLALPTLDASRLTEDGLTVGTPAYMSPEQTTGATLDPRSDLFGLGCLLYAMAAGRSPFADGHRFEIVRKIREEIPTPLNQIRPNVSTVFSEMVARLLAKQPDSRFQSAQEVVEILSGTAPIVPLALPRPERNVPPRRLRWLAWAGTLGLVLLLTAGGVWWRNGFTGTTPRSVPGPRQPGKVLTVARSGSADARTIGDAIALAGPNARIRILDGSKYEETLLIDDPARLTGLTIESDHDPSLVAYEGTVTAVLVKGTPGVSVRGIRIAAGDKQHCVMIEGENPGLTLERVSCSHPEESQFACIVARHGARGTSERPIRLTNCEFTGGELGVVLDDLAKGNVRYFQIENCRFRGPGMHVLLCGDVSDVSIFGNVFVGGTGVGMNMGTDKQPGRVRQVRIGCNTFFETPRWMCLHGYGSADQKVTVFNNLILEANAIEAPHWGMDQLARNWTFRNNWWEAEPKEIPIDLAVSRPAVDLVSRRPADPGFLRPPPGSPLASSGAGGEFPAHIGALLPAGPNDPRRSRR